MRRTPFGFDRIQKNFLEHDCLVMFLITCAIEESDPSASGKLLQMVKRGNLGRRLMKLCPVATSELIPPPRVVAEPLAKLVRRTNVSKPKIQVEGQLAQASRPKPVDQYPLPACGTRVIRSLQDDRHQLARLVVDEVAKNLPPGKTNKR
jgi:hypothetical protein